MSLIRSLSEAEARNLVSKKAENADSLDVSGITNLYEDAAKILATFPGKIILDDLTRISDSAAQMLQEHRGGLSMKGLREFSDSVVESLVIYPGILDLSISPEEVSSLSKSFALLILNSNKNKKSLDFKILREISLESAQVIAAFEGDLLLNQLTSISDPVMTILSEHKGVLQLNGITDLSDNAALALGRHEGELSITSIKIISDKSSVFLSKHKGPLILNMYNLEISIDGAEILSRHQPKINNYDYLIKKILKGRITADCLKWLQHPHGFYNIESYTCYAKEITDEAAVVLGTFDVDEIRLDSVEFLSDRASEGLSKFQGKKIVLKSLKNLSTQASWALTAFDGDLDISELANIKSEAALILVNHENKRRIEIERIKADEQRKIYLEELEKEFLSALKFLNHFRVRYPARESKSNFINIVKSCLNLNDSEDDYRTRIIDLARSHAEMNLSKNDHRSYIKISGLDDCDSDFIVKLYKDKYYRVTHCFRCSKFLVSTVSNECETCGWIRCQCGACGCSYRKFL
jgi:hypothetical protein